MVVQGKVAIAMDQELTKKWRDTGATSSFPGQADSTTTRCLAVSIPAKGWELGWHLVVAYAPVSGPQSVKERKKMYGQLHELIQKSTPRCRLVVGGDFNAEIGARQDDEEREGEVVGTHTEGRRTDSGQELVDFCMEEGLFDVGSMYKQRRRATW